MIINEVYPIDIIKDILKRPDALDTYLGEEVNNSLKKVMETHSVPTLFTIDVRKANPIDYLFAKTAFGNFYQTVAKSQDLDCLFFINKSQIKSLFWGLLASLDGNIHRTGNYELDFQAENNIKISVIDNEIKFVGALNNHEEEILDFINKWKIVEEDAIYSSFKSHISHEKISDSMRNLKNKKFVYSEESSIPNKFYSIYSINEGKLQNGNNNRLPEIG